MLILVGYIGLRFRHNVMYNRNALYTVQWVTFSVKYVGQHMAVAMERQGIEDNFNHGGS